MKRTLKGNSSGNQLSMFFEMYCMRSGCMLSPMLRYKTASKYPPSPCRMPACGMWNVSWADRALWLLVGGRPATHDHYIFPEAD